MHKAVEEQGWGMEPSSRPSAAWVILFSLPFALFTVLFFPPKKGQCNFKTSMGNGTRIDEVSRERRSVSFCRAEKRKFEKEKCKEHIFIFIF